MVSDSFFSRCNVNNSNCVTLILVEDAVQSSKGFGRGCAHEASDDIYESSAIRLQNVELFYVNSESSTDMTYPNYYLAGLGYRESANHKFSEENLWQIQW